MYIIHVHVQVHVATCRRLIGRFENQLLENWRHNQNTAWRQFLVCIIWNHPKRMELLGRANEFCAFLLSFAPSNSPSKKQNSEYADHFAIYCEEYAALTLPADSATPFDDFTGPLKGATVIFSKHEPAFTPDNELGQDSLSFEEPRSEHEEPISPHPLSKEDKFPCLPFQAVNVGQPLPQKRVYLTQSTSLHSGYTECLVSDHTFAYDAGVTPLSLDKARYIASLYALGSRQAKTPLPNMWVICKDEKRNIVALGCSHSIAGDGKRSLQSFVVTVEDTIKETPAGSEKNKAKSGTVKISSCEESFAFSEYEIADYSTTCTVTDSLKGEKLMGDLTVQFAWNNPDTVLSPPPESADAVVKVSATPGYIFSQALATYNELKTLLHLCEIASGKRSWSSLSESPTEEEEEEEEEDTLQNAEKSLVENVRLFLDEVSSPLSQPKEITVISPTSANNVYETRSDLDFPERLWMFAKEATSLEDLQQVFAEVFKAVLLGKVQPFVHRSSTSVLSTLLRKVLLTPNLDEKQDLAPKFQNLLTESKICTCLVQLGIKKMTRDYRAFFISADITTADQLDQFISASKRSQLEMCHALCKLHCVLELTSSVLCLKLPAPSLSALFKSALEVYREMKFEGFCTTPVFSLPLPAYSMAQKSILSLCGSLTPKKWVLSQQKTNIIGGSLGGHGVLGDKMSIVSYRNLPLLDSHREEELDEVEGRYYVYKAHCDCI